MLLLQSLAPRPMPLGSSTRTVSGGAAEGGRLKDPFLDELNVITFTAYKWGDVAHDWSSTASSFRARPSKNPLIPPKKARVLTAPSMRAQTDRRTHRSCPRLGHRSCMCRRSG